MLELWRSLTSGGDPSEIDDQARGSRERLLHEAVNPELIAILAERLEAFIRGGDDKLNALETCYLFEQLGLDATCRGALWTAAALHDYGKLYGRQDGLDAEDGSALVGGIAGAAPLREMSALIQFVVRNHDAVEYIVTGETPKEFLVAQLDRLDRLVRPAAMAMLGVIQLAGAASLGEGRLIPKKLHLYRACRTNEILTRADPHERLRLLSSDTRIPPHGFTTLVQPSSDVPEGLADHESRFIQLCDGLKISFDGLAIEAVMTEHNAETYGFRATAAGVVAAYSSDSGPCEAVERLAAKADLFVCEAGAEKADTRIHLTPEEAGEAAARGASKRLMLAHLLPGTDAQAAREAAALRFEGPVEIAAKGRVVTIGGAI